MSKPTQLLDPHTLNVLHGLPLRTRRAASGYMAGHHRSNVRGASVEFAEHRQYVPGDDIRHLDWRIYGRADRFYIRQYEAETNVRVMLVVDQSRSMRYAGKGRPSKLEVAARIAATLAYKVVSQQDSAGLVTFDSAVRARLGVGKGKRHLGMLVSLLEQIDPAHETDMTALFEHLHHDLRRRSIVVLVSDFVVDADALIGGIDRLTHSGHDVVAFHVMDDDEWDFPFVETTLFEGLEHVANLLVDPQSLRASYLQSLERFTTRLRTACMRNRAEYVPVRTANPIAPMLAEFLARRAGISVAGASNA